MDCATGACLYGIKSYPQRITRTAAPNHQFNRFGLAISLTFT
jgi:hypothetical protein